jgi:hypothetical protein
MVKNNDLLVYGLIGAGALILLTKGNIGRYAGQSVGNTIGGALGGSISKTIESTAKEIIITPYQDAQNYAAYIPFVDDVAFYFARPELRGKLSAHEYEQKYRGWK